MQTETIPLNFVPPRQKHRDQVAPSAGTARWSTEAVLDLIETPFMALLAKAHAVHAEHFDENAVQRSTLLSIKTGGCSEDCGYCSQSARYDTEVGREALMSKDDVIAAAKAAKAAIVNQAAVVTSQRDRQSFRAEPVTGECCMFAVCG